MRAHWFGFSDPRAARLLSPCLLFGAATLLGGCGSDSDHTRKRLAELQDKVTQVQSDNDRIEERLVALEAAQQNALERIARAQPEPERDVRQRLKVIHVAPGGDAPPPEAPAAAPLPSAEDDTRPVIKGTGDKIIKTGGREPAATLSGGS